MDKLKGFDLFNEQHRLVKQIDVIKVADCCPTACSQMAAQSLREGFLLLVFFFFFLIGNPTKEVELLW